MTQGIPEPAGLTAERRGILWMVATMAFLAAADAAAKVVMETNTIAQVVWARYLYAWPMLLIMAPRLRRLVVTQRLAMQVSRGFLLLLTTTCLYTGFAFGPLADVTAVMFVAPVAAVALAVPFLGERVGGLRWIGIGAGFCGAMIIIRPGSALMHWSAFMPLIAACLFACHQTAARHLSRTESAVTILIYTSVVGAVASGLAMPFQWVSLDQTGWLLIAAVGAFSGCANYSMIKAFEAAPAAVVSPFQYTVLLWAIGYGYLIYGDIPDEWTVVGATIIVVTGIWVIRQEGRRA
jgi:drug/metabolite transporter (DMT)-like permease